MTTMENTGKWGCVGRVGEHSPASEIIHRATASGILHALLMELPASVVLWVASEVVRLTFVKTRRPSVSENRPSAALEN